MSTPSAKSTLGQIIGKVSTIVSPEWLKLLPDLFQFARRWWRNRQPRGLYEILDYDVALELLDPYGQMAVIKKRQKVKFLQDNIIAFEDYAWGDGDIFAAYSCTPGVVTDSYKEGDRYNILISLRETNNTGDVTDFYIERTIKYGFTQSEEALQTEIRHQTRRLKVTVIFPNERKCQRMALLHRSHRQTNILGPEHFTDLPDGRQQVVWETTHIKRFEIYTLKWMW